MFNKLVPAFLFTFWVFSLVQGIPVFGFESPEEKDFQVLMPDNQAEIDFPVPWGLRNGRPARVFLSFEVGPDGHPETIETLKSIPHGDYLGVAKSTLKKFHYPGAKPGTPGFAEFHYCVRTDQRSTFSCKIKFQRIDGNPEFSAEKPGDKGFFEIDKYAGSPKVVRPVLPFYPEAAADRGQCGWVKADVTVNRFGVVRAVDIRETSNSGLFSLVVKKALSQFRFEKGEQKTVIRYLIGFEIPGKCEIPVQKAE